MPPKKGGKRGGGDSDDDDGPLPMPLQGLISEPAMQRVNRAAEAGNPEARALVSYFVGQGVGLIDSVRSSRQVVADFMEEFAEALEDMRGFAPQRCGSGA
jgi:NAD(P)H-dependent flavin oxidoreductase YrpB (nitropropane dioxygenase family)